MAKDIRAEPKTCHLCVQVLGSCGIKSVDELGLQMVDPSLLAAEGGRQQLMDMLRKVR